MTAPTVRRLAALVIEAHRTGEPIVDPPVPADRAAAMDCQAEVAAAVGAVAGWKVAVPPQGPVAAPLLLPLICPDGSDRPYADGLAIEVEIACRLAADVPAGADRRAVEAAVDSLLLGIELIRPRLADAGRAPFSVFLSDNLGNAGYVVGPDIAPGPSIDPGGRRCRVTLDGAVLFDAPAAHPQGDVLAPLVAWAAAPNDRLGGLRRGQIVTTGSLCGVVTVPGPGLLAAEIDGFGSIRIRLV